MSESVSLEFRLEPLEAATEAEMGLLTVRLHDVLSGRRDVGRVERKKEAAPAGAKVGEAMTLAALLVELAPAAFEAVLNAVGELLSRPGAVPTRVKVIEKKSSVELEFDPRHTTPEAMAKLVRDLRDSRSR